MESQVVSKWDLTSTGFHPLNLNQFLFDKSPRLSDEGDVSSSLRGTISRFQDTEGADLSKSEIYLFPS